jgi:hypothetical protein
MEKSRILGEIFLQEEQLLKVTDFYGDEHPVIRTKFYPGIEIASFK